MQRPIKAQIRRQPPGAMDRFRRLFFWETPCMALLRGNPMHGRSRAWAYRTSAEARQGA